MIYETIGVDNHKFECKVEIFHNVVIVTETPKSRTGIILMQKHSRTKYVTSIPFRCKT